MSLVLRQAGIRAVSQAVACAGVRLSRFFSASAAASSADELTVEVLPFKLHKLEEGPSTTVTTNKTELMEYFRVMATMRRMEIACDMMYKAKLIRGFCHLYDGQEAVITGLEAASNYGDSIITSYRDHCTHLGRGGTVYEVMAELMGKVDGASRGIGGSMHLYNKPNNFYGGCGIVGAQIPLGAGMALAHKYNKTDNVAYTLYGDGAANQGQKYEAINIAALWELPCIFICENNHYGMGTAEWRAAKSATFFTRGDYIPGLKADGMDVLAVRQAISFAKKFVLENGPIILEVDTYRYHGHSMSDPGSTYRTREEITAMRQERDPIERVRKLLVNNGLAEAEELKQMEKKIKKEVDAAAEQAKKSPNPPNHFTWTNLYAKPDGVKMRGRDSQSWHEALVEPFPFPKHWTEKKQLFDS